MCMLLTTSPKMNPFIQCLTTSRVEYKRFLFYGTFVGYQRFLNTTLGHYSQNPNKFTIFQIVPLYWVCVQKSLVSWPVIGVVVDVLIDYRNNVQRQAQEPLNILKH